MYFSLGSIYLIPKMDAPDVTSHTLITFHARCYECCIF